MRTPLQWKIPISHHFSSLHTLWQKQWGGTGRSLGALAYLLWNQYLREDLSLTLLDSILTERVGGEGLPFRFRLHRRYQRKAVVRILPQREKIAVGRFRFRRLPVRRTIESDGRLT